MPSSKVIVQNGNATVVTDCRVSSADQKDDLSSQVSAMESFCLGSGVAVDEWVTEIGGGMNFKRKGFLKIIDRMQRGEVSKILVAHKDRLMRFGFVHIALESGCEIVIVNQESRGLSWVRRHVNQVRINHG